MSESQRISDSEEDYMSASFLQELAPPMAQETYSERRRKNQIKQSAPSNLSRKEQNLKALQQPIAPTNVGHQLLRKIGYQEGTGLGKERQGQLEPIAITLHPGKRLFQSEEE
jgi:hypothetical protein